MFFSKNLLTENSCLPIIKPSAIAVSAILVSTVMFSQSAIADIAPERANLNYSQRQLTNAGNPAAPAYISARNDSHAMMGGYIDIGGGVEYGNLDDIFKTIDNLKQLFSPPEVDNSTPQLNPSAQEPSESNDLSDWKDIFIENPELEDQLTAIAEDVGVAVGLFAVIEERGYAKAELESELSFVIHEDIWGGTLVLGGATNHYSRVFGLFDDVDFDSDEVVKQLQRIPDFTETDPVQAMDLTGGMTLYYDPANLHAKLQVTNDSLLLIKGTKISEISLSYSRYGYKSDAGDLYWGVKPKFYRVGLANVSFRIGSITDSESLFDDIQDADYTYQNGLDLDLGVVWAAKHYQLGASVASLFEHDYKFPSIDRTEFTSDLILNKLDQHHTYTMERQVKVEAGIFTADRRWSLDAEYDMNAVIGTMRDEYQWVTLTGGYAADGWLLPSFRLGVSRNLAGTELSYVNAGMTLFKYVNLDASTTLDTVELDGKDLKRGLNLSLSVQFDY